MLLSSRFPWSPRGRLVTRAVTLKTSKEEEISRNFVYLDHNATTPVLPEVLEVMLPFLRGSYGNPFSSHAQGRRAARAVATAREQVAVLIGAREAEEVFFTSCGTESDNWAIQGRMDSFAKQHPGKTPIVVTGGTEHPAITQCLERLSDKGEVEWKQLGHDSDGRTLFDGSHLEGWEELERERDSLCLVSVMHSNNETGIIQPIEQIARQVHSLIPQGVVHTDAAQSIGKVPVNIQSLGVDMLTLVGHKFGAPKGVAALYVRGGVRLEPFLTGGGQERGVRGATENVPCIVGLGAACASASRNMAQSVKKMARQRDWLLAGLESSLPKGAVYVNGPRESDLSRVLPNTLSVSLQGLDAAALLQTLGDELAASTGSACHSSDAGFGMSPSLAVMKVPDTHARGTLRLSLGRDTRDEELERGLRLLLRGIEAQQGFSS